MEDRIRVQLTAPFKRAEGIRDSTYTRFDTPGIDRILRAPKYPSPFESKTVETPAKKFDLDIDRQVPIPKTIPRRKFPFLPFQNSVFFKNLKSAHDSEQTKFLLSIIFLLSSILFVFLYSINVFPQFSLATSVFSVSLSIIGFISYYYRQKAPRLPLSFTIRKDDGQSSTSQPIQSPSSIFAKQPSSTHTSVFSGSMQPTLNLYRPFILSDRPNSSMHVSQFGGASDSNIDQLASESLRKVGLTSAVFNKYLVNMKAFIQQNLLAKLIPKLNLDDPIVESMISIPSYEHCRSYVIHRIRILASSSYLAGHYGDRGDKWLDKEWSSDLPSDNRIILSVLSGWISFAMTGMKSSKGLRNIFRQKYIFIGTEPFFEGEDDVLLCSDDWSKFYVMTKYKSTVSERYMVSQGRDSMYAALTLYFFFIKEKRKFLFEGADLTDNPFFMHTVYTRERQE